MEEASNADQDVHDIIRPQGKVRYGSACFPCRQRKVKCNNKLPCDNCVKRNYANLCSYMPKDDSSNETRHQSSRKRRRLSTPDNGSQRSFLRSANNTPRDSPAGTLPSSTMTSDGAAVGRLFYICFLIMTL
jgi:hypothetical protein